MHERRKFLIGIGALLVAPAIVRASSLMAISPLPEPTLLTLTIIDGLNWRVQYAWTTRAVEPGDVFDCGPDRAAFVAEVAPLRLLSDIAPELFDARNRI